MKKGGVLLLQWLILLPCFSQTVETVVNFQTKEGKLYHGTIANVDSSEATLFFSQPGFTIRLATAKLAAFNNSKKKVCFNISSEVEELLKQEAAALLDEIFKACSFPEDGRHQYQYKFCRVKDCSLFLFYTALGYDYATLDYHVVKIDLAAIPASLFSPLKTAPEKTKNSNGLPIVEIARHTNSATYDEAEFRNVAHWNNQPEYRAAPALYFLDRKSGAFQQSAEKLQKTMGFLSQACKK